MSIDVVDLRNFYAQRLGTVARHFVGRGIRRRWTDTQGLRLLGIGYADALSRPVPRGGRALPRLHAGGAGRGEMADRAAGAVGAGRRARAAAAGRRGRPRAAGACAGNVARPHRAAARGLAGAGVGRAVARGGAEPARACGRAWTRRRSATAGPIRARRSRSLLRDAWFTPVAWSEALYVPPIQRGWFLRSAVAWERVGATLSAPFAGVHIVEATKQVYRAIPARREKRVLVPALEPALAPSPGGAARQAIRRHKRTRPGHDCPALRLANLATVGSAVAAASSGPSSPRKSCGAFGHLRPRTAAAAMPPPAVAREAVAALVVRSGRSAAAAAAGCRPGCGCAPVMKDGSRSPSLAVGLRRLMLRLRLRIAAVRLLMLRLRLIVRLLVVAVRLAAVGLRLLARLIVRLLVVAVVRLAAEVLLVAAARLALRPDWPCAGWPPSSSSPSKPSSPALLCPAPAAPGSTDSAAGIAPAPRRSGGSNARRAGSGSRR